MFRREVRTGIALFLMGMPAILLRTVLKQIAGAVQCGGCAGCSLLKYELYRERMGRIFVDQQYGPLLIRAEEGICGYQWLSRRGTNITFRREDGVGSVRGNRPLVGQETRAVVGGKRCADMAVVICKEKGEIPPGVALFGLAQQDVGLVAVEV